MLTHNLMAPTLRTIMLNKSNTHSEDKCKTIMLSKRIRQYRHTAKKIMLSKRIRQYRHAAKKMLLSKRIRQYRHAAKKIYVKQEQHILLSYLVSYFVPDVHSNCSSTWVSWRPNHTG